MADIFGNVQPPAWLDRLTAQQPGELGGIFGELVGGLADSASIAIDKASEKQKQGINTNWIKELPGSIKPGLVEARMNIQNPLWKMDVQKAQINMAEGLLGIQNTQSQIDMRKQKVGMLAHDQNEMSEWLKKYPTWESRRDAPVPTLYTPEYQKSYHGMILQDNKSSQAQIMVKSAKSFTDKVTALSHLSPEGAAEAGRFSEDINRPVTPEKQRDLDETYARVFKAKEDAKLKQQTEGAKPQTIDIDVGGGKTERYVYNAKTGHFELPKQDKAAEVQAKAAAKKEEEKYKVQIDIIKSKIEKLEAAKIERPKDTELTRQLVIAYNDLNKLLADGPKSARATPTTSSGTSGAAYGQAYGGAPKYESKEQVVLDFKNGTISREAAAKILNEQFGVPLK